MTSVDNILEHFGVKGMRWGQRKSQAVSVAKQAKAKAGIQDKSRTRFQKPPAKLSDAELKRRISRMEMEKRYNDLNKRDLVPGEAFTKQLLKNSGQTAAMTLITAGLVFGGKKLIEKKFGPGVIEGMFPKKKK